MIVRWKDLVDCIPGLETGTAADRVHVHELGKIANANFVFRSFLLLSDDQVAKVDTKCHILADPHQALS